MVVRSLLQREPVSGLVSIPVLMRLSRHCGAVRLVPSAVTTFTTFNFGVECGKVVQSALALAAADDLEWRWLIRGGLRHSGGVFADGMAFVGASQEAVANIFFLRRHLLFCTE